MGSPIGLSHTTNKIQFSHALTAGLSGDRES